ncbi:MAG: lipocalin family protein [Nitrospiraceae bacterium]|nr:lipocalin family protein [Nitrospiraceae bacterium]
MKPAIFIIPLVALFLSACASAPFPAPPDVVPSVDLSRYTGTWYEIASFPVGFQEGCVNTKAVYTQRTDGDFTVLNSCIQNGRTASAEGTAWVADQTTNAKLKVSYFWPFRGDYWIIDLGKDYEYSVVTVPQRHYLWILSRTPRMSDEQFNVITNRLRASGFDLSLLKRTTQGVQVAIP